MEKVNKPAVKKKEPMSVRDKLLSMGKFKDVEIEDTPADLIANVIKITTYEIRCPYCGNDEEFEELHGQNCSKCKKELLIE